MTILRATHKEPCLCGGWLTAVDTPRAILFAVVAHQESARHTFWSTKHYGPPWRGPQPTFVPPPDPTLGDLSRPTVRTVDGRSAAGRTKA